jgi:putative inorganic carbon (hco3(-)) transporter
MAGALASARLGLARAPTAVAGDTLDWLVLLGVLGVIATTVLQGPVFMPAAGFVQSGPPLAVFERAAALIGAGALARWLLLGGRALPGALLWGLSVVTGLALLSLLTTAHLYSTREAVVFFASAIVLTLAVLMTMTDTTKARALLAGLALLSAGEATVGAVQYAGGAVTPAYWLSRAFAEAIRTRIHGTLGNPNVLAGFLLVGIGATVLLAVDAAGKRRLLLIASLGLQIAALALTYSRSGYAGLAAFVLLGLVLLWPVRRRTWPVLLAVAVIAAAALALPSVGLRAGSVTLDQGDTAASRLFIWRTAIRMWEAHRVWGTGLGTFNAAYPPYRPRAVMTTYAAIRVPGSAHNDYLQAMAETGLIGVGLLLLAIAWGIARGARRYRIGGEADRVWLGTWAATVGGVGVATVANSTVSVVPNITMVAVFTAAVAAHQSLPHPQLRFHKRLLALPLAAVLLGVPPLLPAVGQSVALHQEASRDVGAGRYLDAVDAFRRAVAADPLNDSMMAYFGDLLADLYLRKINSSAGPWQTARAQAAELYERAARLNPWDGYPHAALGRLRHAEGRYPDAAAAFRDAVALDPYSPRYRLWLGNTLAQMGDRRGAFKQLEAAVRLYPIEMLVIERHEGRGASYKQDEASLAEAHRLLSQVGSMAP